MEIRSIVSVVVLLTVVRSANPWTRCEVARELALKRVPEEQIGDWLCIAEHGSAYNSSAANLRFKWFGGTGYYGMFQINDRYACARYGSICGLGSCDQLLDDELDDDIECMLKVHAAFTRELGDGFGAWSVHKSACRGEGQVPPGESFTHCLDDEVVRVQAYFKRKRAKTKKTANLIASSAPGKVYERCELARELRDRHQLPEDQIASWVCIAYHESRFNTSAEGRLNADGSGDHGLFQISDIYWCSTDPRRPGKACGVTCEAMRDSDITDDVRCVRTIHDEHRRLSGNGFNAWTVYKPYCEGRESSFVHNCFDEERLPTTPNRPRPGIVAPTTPITPPVVKAVSIGKVYDRCELANDLVHKYHFPRDQVATWVCIAYHESRFNTSAEGRLNADGSGDHGLFQISDIYWCSTDPRRPGKACGVTCEAMRDSDITDDVRCVRTIHDEHRRLSGNGFNAWTVYKPYCEGRESSFVHNCFDEERLPTTPNRPRPGIVAPTTPITPPVVKAVSIGKVYDRCELANDLVHKYHFPRDQVATWVCIAYHESRFNTSAEGRLNADGSGDHGLFQISDIYWCSPPGNGWACGVSCADLKDSDITDDVRCVRIIYDEHQRLSGDGFNAWSVYKPYCQGGRSQEFTRGCFGDSGSPSTVSLPRPAITAPTAFPSPPGRTGTSNPGKVFERCELAQLLHLRHGLSLEDTANWVCIAKYQSNFNSSAVGHGPDGVRYHGMFQLSDEFWCSPPGRGWVCGIACERLRDAELADDLACMRHIHEEHQRISGDGYNAWSVYEPHCKGKSASLLDGCFEEGENALEPTPPTTRRPLQAPPKNLPRGKVYQRCELAQELYYRHGLPFDQIATWVCIAHRESNYNVSAIGRLNADGSEDHGLFQISDIYWCSPPGKGWVCGLACSDLEDNDLTDDVECMRTIHEEHTRLSGDGFNAWAVYRPYCKGRSAHYIDGCFEEPTTLPATMRPTYAPPTTITTTTTTTTTTTRPTRPRISTTPFRPWSRATTKRSTMVSNDRFPTTTATTTTTTVSFQRKTATTAQPRLPSTTRPASSATKSTTSLYDFYLNHFGRRPAITAAMPVYTFKPFASRQRTATLPSPTTPPTTIGAENFPTETTTRASSFNRWFQSG